ncbi:hypothetical protein PINS_up010005 [Pythium insidiosum]|nr:hypothetical protein PINS_up010005 [Pythium insidiosum]
MTPLVNCSFAIASSWLLLGLALALNATCSAPSLQSRCQSDDAFLLIGIKTDAVHGAAARQAIRETWGHPQSTSSGVHIVFLGCAIDERQLQFMHERDVAAAAINAERQAFGDLLTHELDCVDGYERLVDKALAFFRYAASVCPHHFVMLVDDDVYLRVDRLVVLLRGRRPRERFYAGQVWATQLRRPVRPQRDPQHRNFLSTAQYAGDALPLFANGPHVVLSMDCVAFIAQQRRADALGALDDVSIASWLLAMDVKPLHLPSFLNLRDSLCRADAVSIADVSPFGLRRMHANALARRSLCNGFCHRSWIKPTPLSTPSTRVLRPSKHFLSINWSVEFLSDDVPELQITVRVRPLADARDDDPHVDALFVPSAVSPFEFCRTMEASLRRAFAGLQVDVDSFCVSLQAALSAFITRSVRATPSLSTLYALLHHNLHCVETDPVVVVAFSRMASSSKLLLECLFTRVFHGAQVLLLPEDEVESPPAVLAFSLLDGNCSATPDAACLHERHRLLTRYDASTRLLVLAGEPWPLPLEFHEHRVIALSTLHASTEKHHDQRHVYLPQASASFGERLRHRPHDLLQPSLPPPPDQDEAHHRHRRFCAYLYARCDRPQREYMFDLLNAEEPVDALGACQGAGRQPNTTRLAGRFAPFFNDDAVAQFRAFRFVLAFENTAADDSARGYVTEKIVNAFLAGSVPIFWGHSRSVAALFNPESFIDCGAFPRLRDCATHVLRVHRNASLYASYRRAPPIRDRSAFERVFSWHPDVESDALATQVRRLLYDD